MSARKGTKEITTPPKRKYYRPIGVSNLPQESEDYLLDLLRTEEGRNAIGKRWTVLADRSDGVLGRLGPEATEEEKKLRKSSTNRRHYLINNPDVYVEALRNLDERRVRRAIRSPSTPQPGLPSLPVEQANSLDFPSPLLSPPLAPKTPPRSKQAVTFASRLCSPYRPALIAPSPTPDRLDLLATQSPTMSERIPLINFEEPWKNPEDVLWILCTSSKIAKRKYVNKVVAYLPIHHEGDFFDRRYNVEIGPSGGTIKVTKPGVIATFWKNGSKFYVKTEKPNSKVDDREEFSLSGVAADIKRHGIEQNRVIEFALPNGMTVNNKHFNKGVSGELTLQKDLRRIAYKFFDDQKKSRTGQMCFLRFAMAVDDSYADHGHAVKDEEEHLADLFASNVEVLSDVDSEDDEMRADPPSDRPTPPVDSSLLRSVPAAQSQTTANPTTSMGARSRHGMPMTTEGGHHLVGGGDAIMGDETQFLKRNRNKSKETDGAKPRSVQTFLPFAEYPPLATTGHNAARAGSAAAASQLGVPTAAPAPPTFSPVHAAREEFRQSHQVVGERIEGSVDQKDESDLFQTIIQLEDDANQEVENGTTFIDLLGTERMQLDGDASKRMADEAFSPVNQLQEKEEDRTKRMRSQQQKKQK